MDFKPPIQSSTPAPKINVWARHKSRVAIIKALYQWQFYCSDVVDIISQIQKSNTRGKVDWAYFTLSITEITQGITALEENMQAYLDRPMDKLDKIEKAILVLGVWEILQGDIDTKVIINEAVKLAKIFGGTDSYKYINAILDAVAINYSHRSNTPPK